MKLQHGKESSSYQGRLNTPCPHGVKALAATEEDYRGKDFLDVSVCVQVLSKLGIKPTWYSSCVPIPRTAVTLVHPVEDLFTSTPFFSRFLVKMGTVNTQNLHPGICYKQATGYDFNHCDLKLHMIHPFMKTCGENKLFRWDESGASRDGEFSWSG